MQIKANRILDFSLLEVGRMYFVKCGIWQGYFLFCGCDQVKKRIYYRFSVGQNVEDWVHSFNIYTLKRRIQVFQLVDDGGAL